MEVLASGFGLAEAPRPDPAGGIWFSDALLGGIHRIEPDGSLRRGVFDRRGVGGLLPHRDGGVVASGREVVHLREGVAVPRELLGRRPGVTGYNDLGVDAAGQVFAGALHYRPFAGEDSRPGEVWRIESDGEAEPVVRGVVWPNGIVVTSGGTLLVCDYASGEVLRDGTAMWRSPSGEADGCAIDAEGGLWVATGSGGGLVRIELFPDGSHAVESDRLEIPGGPFVSSCAFAGDGLRELLVTTGGDPGDAHGSGRLLRLDAPIAGAPVALAAV